PLPRPPRRLLFPYTTLFRSEILSIAGDGSVREYQINRILVYRIRHSDGRTLVEPTALRAQRDYNYDDDLALAKQREADLLYEDIDRKSTRLNSSHVKISYAV